uniref:Peptidase S1 domain-containing protein n=1 Tax=Globodera rostochiensis TaxID=31243 RepID=A0A914IE36_GLORO
MYFNILLLLLHIPPLDASYSDCQLNECLDKCGILFDPMPEAYGTERSMGSTVTPEHCSPWTVLLLFGSTYSTKNVLLDRCTGFIVAPDVILTAAHCIFMNYTELAIRCKYPEKMQAEFGNTASNLERLNSLLGISNNNGCFQSAPFPPVVPLPPTEPLMSNGGDGLLAGSASTLSNPDALLLTCASGQLPQGYMACTHRLKDGHYCGFVFSTEEQCFAHYKSAHIGKQSSPNLGLMAEFGSVPAGFLTQTDNSSSLLPARKFAFKNIAPTPIPIQQLKIEPNDQAAAPSFSGDFGTVEAGAPMLNHQQQQKKNNSGICGANVKQQKVPKKNRTQLTQTQSVRLRWAVPFVANDGVGWAPPPLTLLILGHCVTAE